MPSSNQKGGVLISNPETRPTRKLTTEQERGSAFPPKGACCLLFIDESAGQSDVLAG